MILINKETKDVQKREQEPLRPMKLQAPTVKQKQ